MDHNLETIQRMAEEGYPAAQYNFGICHLQGEGVLKDMTKAMSWFQQAAENGLPEAQYNLALPWHPPGRRR